MKKKHTVSIGIPAFNEEKKIASVIRSLLSQSEDNWSLREIRVYNDGSTDQTVRKVTSLSDQRIVLIDDHQRIGKTQRLNQIFAEFSGDILIMFDADIVISDKELISKIVTCFADETVGLVGGNSRPHIPKTFVERAVYSTFEVFDASRKIHNGGNNVFCSTGSCLAVRKELAKKVVFPKIVNEDVYLYLDCLKLKWKFQYCESAIVSYALPSNFTDYIKQVIRSEPLSALVELEKYFPSIAKRELIRTGNWYKWEIVKAFLRNPVGVFVIIFINVVCRPFLSILIRNYKLGWFTAQSTH